MRFTKSFGIARGKGLRTGSGRDNGRRPERARQRRNDNKSRRYLLRGGRMASPHNAKVQLRRLRIASIFPESAENIGRYRKLVEAGVKENDTVDIYGFEFDFVY